MQKEGRHAGADHRSTRKILRLLAGSRLGNRPEADRVKIALAIHLFQEGVVSIGKAAELAGEPRASFEWFLVQMGIPTVRYELSGYEEDLRTIAKLSESRREA